MSRDNQHATSYLIARGGDIEAVDTYGYTPLGRMASNNLAIGASALLSAGADPQGEHISSEGPVAIALASEAHEVLSVLRDHGEQRGPGTRVARLEVFSTAHPEVSGGFLRQEASKIPPAFAEVCNDNGWEVQSTWEKLNGGEDGAWFAHEDDKNPSYIYFNNADSMWWIDGPDGLGVYKAPGPSWAPPGASIRWVALDRGTHRPALAIYRQSNSISKASSS